MGGKYGLISHPDGTLTQIYNAEDSDGIDGRIQEVFNFLAQQGFGIWGSTGEMGATK